MEIKRRNNRGITLIALVVTIVVLLILAGVSLAMLRGTYLWRNIFAIFRCK